MVEPHAIPNDRRLADDDTGSMIDEEALPDPSAGMNVNSGLRLRDRRYDARDEPRAQEMQPVSKSVMNDGNDAAITNENFIDDAGSGIARIGGLDIAVEFAADVGEHGREFTGNEARNAI